jgi:hypothetical protein
MISPLEEREIESLAGGSVKMRRLVGASLKMNCRMLLGAV